MVFTFSSVQVVKLEIPDAPGARLACLTNHEGLMPVSQSVSPVADDILALIVIGQACLSQDSQSCRCKEPHANYLKFAEIYI